MMRAEYDSEADALSIDVLVGAPWGDGEGIDADYCTVTFVEGGGDRVANVELLSPRQSLQLLSDAAAKYSLDAEALDAAARSALAAPDRVVTLELGERQAGSAEPLSR